MTDTTERRTKKTPAPLTFRDDLEIVSARLKIITPVFGGGVKVSSVDPHLKEIDQFTPMRTSAVRGHLRFWWRATTGAWCSSMEEMVRREAELWGWAGRSGLVSLSVSADGSASLRPVPNAKWPDGFAYALFPLSPARRATGNTPGTVTGVDGAFRLTVRGHQPLSEQQTHEVKLAVSAWVVFGAIGGRTTRGLGQLAPEAGSASVLLDHLEVLQEVRKKGSPPLGQIVPAIAPDQAVVLAGSSDNALSQLGCALQLLQRFRQGPGEGRRAPRGRTYWPEADAIRAITGCAERNHRDPMVRVVRKFPRAAFGLPIITHFKTESGQWHPHRDPEDTELKPVGGERMRSPLQVFVVRQNGGFRSGFLLLSSPRPGRLELKCKRLDQRGNLGGAGSVPVEHQLTDAELQRLHDQPSGQKFRDNVTSTDILQAFMGFARRPA